MTRKLLYILTAITVCFVCSRKAPASWAKLFCTVQVGPGTLSFGPQCPFGQVMTGTENDMLLCSEVQVSCQF